LRKTIQANGRAERETEGNAKEKGFLDDEGSSGAH